MNMEITSKFHNIIIGFLKALKKCAKLRTFGSERDTVLPSAAVIQSVKWSGGGGGHLILTEDILS